MNVRHLLAKVLHERPPTEEEVLRCWEMLYAKALANPGHVYTAHLHGGREMKVLIPKLPLQRTGS